MHSKQAGEIESAMHRIKRQLTATVNVAGQR
jgi:hypothetical protein